jgi:predicted lipid-binding transport protein (Tim44 family)
MGDQVIDILLFGMVAVFLVFRLYSVLGRRTGTERPPEAAPGRLRRVAAPDNVVSLSDRTKPADVGSAAPVETVDHGLAQIRAADPAFRSEPFIDGARHAFDLIVKSFAEGDTATLRPLVSDDVYDAFAEVIRHRLSVKESVDTRVVKLADPELVGASLDGRTASITVKFVSSQISITRAADGKIVEGDPERALERTDFWTFSRNVRSQDPNWILTATGSPE